MGLLYKKNVCFQNVYVAQMIVNGFLHFGIFKTNSIILKFGTQTCDRVKYFVFVEKKYPSCQP